MCAEDEGERAFLRAILTLANATRLVGLRPHRE